MEDFEDFLKNGSNIIHEIQLTTSSKKYIYVSHFES